MKRILLLSLLAVAFSAFGLTAVSAQRTGAVSGVTGNVDPNTNVPPAMKRGCKNYLGRPMQSLCTTEEAYNSCFAYLKAGKWDYCAYTGKEEMRARRTTEAEARKALIAKFCVEKSASKFTCPDVDYNLSTAYLDCLAYQNGTGKITCEKPFDLITEYADKIEAKLKGNPVGYAFVITNNKGRSVERAWGSSRKSPDSPTQAMTVDSRYSVASVSKNVTGAAVMKLLAAKNIRFDAKVEPYLPPDWKLPDSSKSLSFIELLTHHSGIRCAYPTGDVRYDNLKKCLEEGINTNLKNVDCDGNSTSGPVRIGCYNNYNYALFRLIIPRLDGYSETAKLDDPGKTYALKYIDYINVNLFSRGGFGAFCRPSDGDKQPLTYKLSAPSGKGGDFGDMTLRCGSQGWFLSAKNLSSYLNMLNRTEAIIPTKVRDSMLNNLIGYTDKQEFTTKYGKIELWWHGGFHPASMNPGEINTNVMRFSNGVQIAFIMNSDLPAGTSYMNALVNSMREVLEK